MKKILLLVTAIFLTGCQNKNLTLNEEVRYKGWNFKLTNVQFSDTIGAGQVECESTIKTNYDFNGLIFDCLKETANKDEDFIVIEGKLNYLDDTKSSLNFDLKIDKGKYYKSFIVDQDELIFIGGEYAADKKTLTVNDPSNHNSFTLRAIYVVDEKDDNFVIELPFGYNYIVKRN